MRTSTAPGHALAPLALATPQYTLLRPAAAVGAGRPSRLTRVPESADAVVGAAVAPSTLPAPAARVAASVDDDVPALAPTADALGPRRACSAAYDILSALRIA